MPEQFDALVVGGGHNGLVAAAYLAQSGLRTVVLEARHKTGGAATTESPWPDAPEFKVTRLVVRRQPHAVVDHQGPQPGASRLQGVPDGSVLPGVSRRSLDQDLRRRRAPKSRRDRQVLQGGRRGDAEMGCVDGGTRGRARPDADGGAAEHRLAAPARRASAAASRVAPSRPLGAHRRATSPV